MKKILTLIGFVFMFSAEYKAQDYIDDVMLQSFGWDEFQQPRITTDGSFYEFLGSRAGNLKAVGFDMVWLPPASASTGGVGYFPTQLFNFSQTSWGSETQLKKMLTNMNAKGIYPIADVVVNHRSGTTSWTDFTNPTWGCETICSDDEASSGSYVGCRPSGAPDTGERFDGSRDLDHTNVTVQNGVKEFLSRLKALGYKGWRWDVAKGFSPYYFGNYIQDSQPYYSVGEFWDGNMNNLKNWINGTYGGGINASTTVSGVFDFSLYYTLSGALSGNNFSSLNSSGNSMAGLAGQYGFSEKAVTFIDNHDTFVKPEAILGANLMKGYAYILTHPGIPCVFAPHYYGGSYTKDGVTRVYSDNVHAINKLMAVRKANLIDAYSYAVVDQAGVGLYAAYIKKRFSDSSPVVAVKIGNNSWSPTGAGWNLVASGTDYAVWSKAEVNAPPVVAISPSSRIIVSGTSQTITIAASDDSGNPPTIRYTTDGSEPTSSSTIYTAPFSINSSTTQAITVKAAAFDAQGLSSGSVERVYQYQAPSSIVIRFKPPTSTPNWPLPKIHYWGEQPVGSVPAAVWATPINMTADPVNSGWFMYTFPNVAQISFLFRDGNSTGTLGVTKTADITNVTQSTAYEWDPTSSTYVKINSTLATNEVKVNNASLVLLQNPVENGLAEIRFSNAKNGVVAILDVSGKLLKTQKLTKVSGDEKISVSGLKSGLYILQLKSDQGTSTVKMMIK